MTNPTTSDSQTMAANNISAKNKSQCSAGLVLQTYSNSVLEQPKVDFSGQKELIQYETDINNGLATAQGHASKYLNEIQPNILKNITNIANYYALHTGVATALPPGSTSQQWIDSLTALKQQSAVYESLALATATAIQNLHDKLTADASSFAKTVINLNTAVNGDNGVLDALQTEVSQLQGKIDGAIAGTVMSGLATVGGAFMIAVGGISDFITAGTSTPLVVAGVGVVAAGIGGEVGAGIALKNLNDEKAAAMAEEERLSAEVKLALGISSGYQSLADNVKSAVTAATEMANAWNFLGSTLDTCVSDLNNGILSTDVLQTIWLMASNTVVKSIQSDIATIKQQMAGVQLIVATSGQTVGQALIAAIQTE